MASQRKRWARTRAPADGVPVFDDVDPDVFFNPQPKTNRNHERQTSRVCRVAYRVVSELLMAEVSDPWLQSLQVMGVEPAPDASRLVVRVCSDEHALSSEIMEQRLQRAQGLMRTALAQALQRKRTPQLAFVVVPRETEESWE